MRLRGLVFVVAVGTGACAKKAAIPADQIRSTGPTKQTDVGIVVENATPEALTRIVRANPSTRVRVLNPKHGMYEIFGLADDSQLAKEGLSGTRNRFFSAPKPKPGQFASMAVSGPVGLQVGALNPCEAGDQFPVARLTALEPSGLGDGGTIEIGESVRVSGANSSAKMAALVVVGPSADPQSERVIDDNQFQFTPVALGPYQVLLVVQDEKNVCGMDILRFMVTANRPYAGPAAKPISLDLSLLSHLAMVSAPESWSLSEGEGVLIAVIDTGVQYNHRTLAGAIRLNSGEIPENGIDDDGNGLVDDQLGYDFSNSDPFPYDDVGHGTHVAALAAGRPFGLARRAEVLPVKALSGFGGDIAGLAAAILYSVDRGARVINMSLGGSAERAHPLLIRAMDYARDQGVLVVAAAGNGDETTGLGYSIDEIPTFPASMEHDNLLTVASFDAENVLSAYSNFGPKGVDVVAPGGSESDPMISAAYENPENGLFTGMIGTSMATPVVAGIAAQVWSLHPTASALQIKDAILRSGDEFPTLKPVTVSGRHVNAAHAVRAPVSDSVLF